MAEGPNRWSLGFSGVAILISLASLAVSFWSFNVGRENTEISQRAYLTIDTPKVSYTKAGQLKELEAVIRNLGNTPARNVEISLSFTDGEDGKGKRVEIEERTIAGDIAPKDEFEDPESFDDALVAPFTERKPFSYFMTVRYSDVFGKRHSLQICWAIERRDVGQCDSQPAGEE